MCVKDAASQKNFMLKTYVNFAIPLCEMRKPEVERIFNSCKLKFNERIANGENFIDLNNCVKEFMDKLVKQNYQKVVIVTHAGVIRSVLCRILEIPLHNAFKIPIDYGSITKININKKPFYESIGFINKNL